MTLVWVTQVHVTIDLLSSHKDSSTRVIVLSMHYYSTSKSFLRLCMCRTKVGTLNGGVHINICFMSNSRNDNVPCHSFGHVSCHV